MVQCILTQDWDKALIIEVTEWGVRAIVLDETCESSGWLEHDSRYLRAPFVRWPCAACSKHRMKAEFTNAQLKKMAISPSIQLHKRRPSKPRVEKVESTTGRDGTGRVVKVGISPTVRFTSGEQGLGWAPEVLGFLELGYVGSG